MIVGNVGGVGQNVTNFNWPIKATYSLLFLGKSKPHILKKAKGLFCS